MTIEELTKISSIHEIAENNEMTVLRDYEMVGVIKIIFENATVYIEHSECGFVESVDVFI